MTDDNPAVIIPPPLIALAGLALGMALDGRLADPHLNPMSFQILGAALSSVGLVLVTSALGLFRRYGTRKEPWKPSAALVTDGVYKLTRNPMYVGMLLAYAGIMLMAGWLFSLGPFLTVVLILQFYVVRREEAYLQRRFGDDYRMYREQVRRWV
jgi:protein-S-isoprenylcysteine O-methyltransferase Ste14